MPFVTVAIDGGLDLVTPPVAVQPGRLQACENFEVALNQGVKSIDGYERFDGGSSPSFFRVYKITGDWATFGPGAGPPYWEAGSRFTIAGGPIDPTTNYDGNVIGFYKDDAAETIELWIVFINALIEPSPLFAVGNIIYDIETLSEFEILAKVGYVTAFDQTDTVQANLDNAAAAYTYTRDTVQEVPGQGNVLGLFWLKDELYACRDYFTLAYADEIAPSYPGDELYIGASYAAATWKGFLAKDSVTDADGTSGEASGVYMFYDTTGTATAATIYNHTQGDIAVATITEVGATAQGAGLYRADGGRGPTVSTQSWTHQDLGSRVRYKDQLIAFTPLNRVAQTTSYSDLIVSTDWVVSGTTLSAGNWLAQGGTPGQLETVLDGSDLADTVYAGYGMGQNGLSPYFWVNNFGLSDADIPDGSTITGFTVEINRRAYRGGSVTTGNVYDGSLVLKFPNGTGGTASFADSLTAWPINGTNPDFAQYAAVQYGGEQSLLGYTGISPDSVRDTEFGIRMAINVVGKDSLDTNGGALNSATRITPHISLIKIQVHYIPPQGGIYFWNGTSAVTAEVVQSYLTSGQIGAPGNDGAGHLFLMNVGTNRPVLGGEEIRSLPAAGTAPDGGASDGSQLLATTENSVTKNVMDWGALLTSQGKKPNNSKYTYDISNFYAAAGFDAIYGVSGAGPAFMYDGYAFSRIYTGTPEEYDTPRHVVVHQQRLFLGYKSGSVQFSVAGEPLNFDPLAFAGEIGVGAAVRGLMQLNGDTLAELTQKGVSMIQGDVGLGPYPGVISPDVGCVEYSAQSMGQYMYTSFRGIQNLRATQAYGDFDTSQFSWDVWSWLRPRVQNSAFFESSPIGVINSLAVRNKAQYRLMFADGKQLTATFLREAEMPQFTIQQYYHADGTTPLTWDVVTAGVESNGRDRLFGATNDGTGYVYEIDRGYSFDGGNIDGFVELVVMDQGAAQQNKIFTDMQIHGIATDYATFSSCRSTNYGVPDPTKKYDNVFGSATVAPTGEESYFSSAVPIRNAGRNLTLRFDRSSNKQPPVYLQAVSYNLNPAGEKRT